MNDNAMFQGLDLDAAQTYAPDEHTPKDERAYSIAWQGKGKWAHLRVSRSRDLGGDFFMARNDGKTVGGRFRSLDQALKALGL